MHRMNRRQFIHTAAIAATATTFLPLRTAPAAEKPSGVNWPIGCFNRPWLGDKTKWNYDTALDGIKAAGYKLTGMLTRTPLNISAAVLGAHAFLLSDPNASTGAPSGVSASPATSAISMPSFSACAGVGA